MRRTTTLTALAVMALPLGLSAAPADAATTCDGRTATVVVAEQPDGRPTAPVTGTPGDDVIVGTEANDTIDGAGGNDTICGLGGADLLTGGVGDDRLFGGLDSPYYVDDGYFGDLIVPGPGDDHVDLGSDPQLDRLWRGEYPADLDQVSYAGSTTGVRVDLAAGTASGEGTDTIAVPSPARAAGIVGSAYDDHLSGTSAEDRIDAGAGDDEIVGGDGNNALKPDSVGRTTAVSFRDPASLPGNDRVEGGADRDVITSFLGSDHLSGGSGKDYLVSYSPDAGSVLEGGSDDDGLVGVIGTSLRGGSGDDDLVGEFSPPVRQEVDGGRGKDRALLSLPGSKTEPGQHIRVDVPGEQIKVDGTLAVRYQGIERLNLEAPRGRVTYLGSGRADVFFPSWSTLQVRAFGRGGRDQLGGGRFADLLDGGAGRDKLDGGRGRDRCLRGERLSSCERRR